MGKWVNVSDLQKQNTAELRAMRSVLLRQLGRVGPLIDGSTLVAQHSCGNKKGKKTPQMRVQRYRDKKLHAVHVPRDLEETVQEWNGEYQRVLDLLCQIGEVSEQIIRNYVGDKHARRRAEAQRAQFRLVDKDARGKR